MAETKGFTPLTPGQVQRYSRHLIMDGVGSVGQRKLIDSKVLIVGAGGLGSPVALYLALAGVGTIGIVDFDTVDVSNLQRQILHTDADVGRPKVISAKETINAHNPETNVILHEEPINSDNAMDIILNYDIIVNGADTFAPRYLVNDACVLLNKPNVYGSIFRFEGQATVFNYKGGPHYRDLYPEPPPPGMVPSCAEGGVLGILPGIIGVIQATETVKIILGVGEPLSGRLLVIDTLGMGMRSLSYSHDPSRATVTDLSDYEIECSNPEDVVEEPQREMFEINPADYVQRVNRGWSPFLLDVRRMDEERIVSLEGTSLRIQHNLVPQRVEEVPHDRDVVIYCRTGSRSAAVARFLIDSRSQEGYVYNLTGGIHKWSDTVDSSIIKY